MPRGKRTCFLKKGVEAVLPSEKDRSSPCAGKCRHRWCAGYNAGYYDQLEDTVNNVPNRR